MGSLRVFLAYAVIAAHFPYFHIPNMVGGEIAVEGFYIISGFYIALILSSQYTNTKNFLINRFLRLYPAYFLISILALAITWVDPKHIQNLFELPGSAIGYIILTNTTMLFQDLSMFLAVINGHLSFVTDPASASNLIFQYLLIPQGWTLGIEISFYALAPLMFSKGYKYIYTIFIISLVLRIFLHTIGLIEDPWSYRFFPTELALFMLGAMSFQLYSKMSNIKEQSYLGVIGKIGLTLCIAYCIYFPHISAAYEFKKGIFYILLFAFIPFIFNLSKTSKFDRLLGNLSYPLYLIWGVGLTCTDWVAQSLNLSQNRYAHGLIFFLLIIIGALAINQLIDNPIDRFRKRFRQPH